MDTRPVTAGKSDPQHVLSSASDESKVSASDTFTSELIAHVCHCILERLQQRRITIAATYRLQMHGKGFRFHEATQRVPYLASLGVSHIYSSPVLKSQCGSIHGYDVIDPTELNDELGSLSDFEQFVGTLHTHDLGLLVDIVPNHMSVASDENKWWMDVLKHGPSSRYAKYFDIDWQPARGSMAGRILLPILDAASGEVLEAGRIAIRFRMGAFYAEYEHTLLPLEPKTWIELLSPRPQRQNSSLDNDLNDPAWIELYSIMAAVRNLPSRDDVNESNQAERCRETLVIEQRLDALIQRSAEVAEHISVNLRSINGQVGNPRSFDLLDALLEQQPYRLVYWKASSDEINYRRFFDVSTLAALSIENREVFDATHQLFFKMAAAGQIDACRVDHVDGLFDPEQYLWRLQWCYAREVGKQVFEQEMTNQSSGLTWQEIEVQVLAQLHDHFGGQPPEELSTPRSFQSAQTHRADQPSFSLRQWPLSVHVEKILGVEEPLPPDWPVKGTTGYDFMNSLNGVFIEPEGYGQLKKCYNRFVGNQQSFEDIVYECKRLILSGPMQSEVTLLASRLERIAKSARSSRDFTLNALEFAIQEIIACFAVYRTYIHAGSVSPRDEQLVQRATAMAKRRNPAVETNTFDFVRDVLLLKEPHGLSEKFALDREYLVGRFQQVTSPVQAKGVEDTAFYRYIPLLSIDEVGGEPRRALLSVEQFHEQNIKRQTEWPGSMLATTTHDTKRTEDVRARLNVLSEAPGRWRTALQRWQRLNRKHVRQVDGHDAPCRNDQWLFYQTLIGIWPVSPPTLDQRRSLIARVQQYMEKATHEAKLHTSWISPNPAYDAAVNQFIQTVLEETDSKFALDLQTFVNDVLDAGLINAASQVLIKLTSPGVPDIYQGQELWDFSLVDPDNRRPVNYDLRQHLLAEIRQATSDSESRVAFARYLNDHPRDDRLKLYVTLESLAARQQLGLGSANLRYVPLSVSGPAAAHLIAYGWYQTATDNQQCVAIVIAPRFIFKLTKQSSIAQRADASDLVATQAQSSRWTDTVVELPVPLMDPMRNQFTGEVFAAVEGVKIHVAQALKEFPMALLSTPTRPIRD